MAAFTGANVSPSAFEPNLTRSGAHQDGALQQYPSPRRAARVAPLRRRDDRAAPPSLGVLGAVAIRSYDPLPPGFEWAANTTIQNQADWLARAATLSKEGKRVRLMVVWNVDSTVYAADPQAGYAIVRRDGSCLACITLGAAMTSP